MRMDPLGCFAWLFFGGVDERVNVRDERAQVCALKKM
jgi:hypothetical protein